MKKKYIITIFQIFFGLHLFSQNCLVLSDDPIMASKQIEGAIELWCEEYFNSCFGWNFIGVSYISDITPLPNGKIMVKGVNKNTGLFGKEYSRDFKATLNCISENKLEIQFKKQEKYRHAPDRWAECTKVITY